MRVVRTKLTGEDIELRPSFEALEDLEQITGLGVQGVGVRYAHMNLSSTIIAAIIYAGMKAAGRNVTLPDVKARVFKHGLSELIGPVGEFINEALRGGDFESEKKN